jgi:hypothetical protein
MYARIYEVVENLNGGKPSWYSLREDILFVYWKEKQVLQK